MNIITEETYNLWLENIEWFCIHFKLDGHQAAEEILSYLIGEGAFSVEKKKDKTNQRNL